MDGWMDVVDKRETRDAAAKQEVQHTHTDTPYSLLHLRFCIYIVFFVFDGVRSPTSYL